MAAGVETMRILVDTNPYPELEKCTSRLVEGLRKFGLERGLAVDYVGGSLFQLRFGMQEAVRSRDQFAKQSDQAKSGKFIDILQDRGVRPTSRRLFFVSIAHSDQIIDRTLEIAESALATLRAHEKI